MFKFYQMSECEKFIVKMATKDSTLNFGALNVDQNLVLDRNESGRDDIGFLLFSGIGDSQELDTDDAIQGALVFKMLGAMEVCTQRFYSLSFPGDKNAKDNMKTQMMKFWKSMLKLTHIGTNLSHFD